jgi:hypothetical protein
MTSGRYSRRAWLAVSWLAVVGGALLLPAVPAHAGKDSAAFRVTLSDGRTFFGNRDVTIPAARGTIALVSGTYVEFLVDLDTFAVGSYTLTGAPSPSDITGGRRTVIFERKVPEHGSLLTSNLSLKLDGEKLELRRSGPGIGMKIQAKDATQGGIFQMEPSRTITYVHQLAPGFEYFTDRLGRTLLTNLTLVGRESPEAAAPVERTPTASLWQVQGGGRMGMVLGEDAVE